MERLNVPAWKLGIGFILMGGALLLAACNSTKFGQASDDKAITTQVQAKLFDDPVLKMRDIHVTSDNGTVTLSGSVNTELEKAAVERVASQADGVKKIVNQLEIASAGAGAETAAPPTAASSGATARQSKAPAEQPRASAHRHHARSLENNEATTDQVAAAETPGGQPASCGRAGCSAPARSRNRSARRAGRGARAASASAGGELARADHHPGGHHLLGAHSRQHRLHQKHRG